MCEGGTLTCGYEVQDEVQVGSRGVENQSKTALMLLDKGSERNSGP